MAGSSGSYLRAASRIEDLGESREFEQRVRQSSGEFERAVSLIRAEADQKRNAGNQVGRVEGPIESLLHKKKREAAARAKLRRRKGRLRPFPRFIGTEFEELGRSVSRIGAKRWISSGKIPVVAGER